MGEMQPFLSFPNLRNVGKDSRYVIQSEAKDLGNIKWVSSSFFTSFNNTSSSFLGRLDISFLPDFG